MKDLHGVIVALVTPMTASGDLNESGLRSLIKHVIQGGVHGLFVNGTTGEFYAFDLAQKRRSLEIAMEESRGRLPVIAGAAGITTRAAIEEVKLAESVGADAVAVLTPMFVGPSQEELYCHFKSIAEAASVPVLMYNNPAKTAVSLTADTVQRLSAIDNIIGVKDSSGDMNLAGEFIRRTPRDRFKVFMGRDNLILAALTYGASGAVAATANVAPGICAEIYGAFCAGDSERALAAQNRLTQLRAGFALGTFPAVVKEALKLMGIDAGLCAAPIRGLADEQRKRLEEILSDLGLLGK